MKTVKALVTFSHYGNLCRPGDEVDLRDADVGELAERHIVEIIADAGDDPVGDEPAVTPIGAEPVEYECGDCGNKFTSQRGLTLHRTSAHGGATDESTE